MFFGLSVAYDLLGPSNQPAIQALVTRLLNFLTGHAWNIVMPDGTITTTFIIRPDEQLGLLQIGRQVNPTQFGSAYQSLAAWTRRSSAFQLLSTASTCATRISSSIWMLTIYSA